MPYRYWLAVTMLGLVVAFGSPVQSQQVEGDPGQRQVQTDRTLSDLLSWAIPVQILGDHAETEALQHYAEQRELDGLVVQHEMAEDTRRMADYSELQTYFVGIGTIVLILTLCFTSLANRAAVTAARAAHDTVVVTREMGMKQIRAYIFCETISLQWCDDDSDNIEHIVFKWKNSGQSPAKNVDVKTILAVVPSPDLVDNMTEEDLRELEADTPLPRRYSFLSSGETMKTMTTRISADKVAAWREGHCAILAYGVLRYVDEFEMQRYSSCCYKLVYEETPTRHVTHFERLGVGNHYR